MHRLITYQKKHMKQNDQGVYPPDQVKAMNRYFHSLKDIKLYHVSQNGGLTDLKPGMEGKSKKQNMPVYASPSKEFVCAFLIHDGEQTMIDTSTLKPRMAINNYMHVANGKSNGFLYEIDVPHTEFQIDPNSKFGLFEVTCPHAVRVKKPEFINDPLCRIEQAWEFYIPPVDVFFERLNLINKGDIPRQTDETLKQRMFAPEYQIPNGVVAGEETHPLTTQEALIQRGHTMADLMEEGVVFPNLGEKQRAEKVAGIRHMLAQWKQKKEGGLTEMLQGSCRPAAQKSNALPVQVISDIAKKAH